MKLKYYNILIGLLVSASCSKEIEVHSAPDFEVTTDKTTYQVGEEVFFNIKGGNADEISFYSGEETKNYAYKDGRTIDISAAPLTMSFRNSVQIGTQPNQLSVHYSTDFNGDYSSIAAINAATWTNITSLWPLATNATFVPAIPALPASPDISRDISSLKVPGKPLYIGFKYYTKPQATNGIARRWYIENFAINSKVQYDGLMPIVLADQASAGFRIVDDNKDNEARSRSLISTTRVTLEGNLYNDPNADRYNPDHDMYDPANPFYDPSSPLYVPTLKFPTYVPYDPTNPYNDPEVEHWAISKAIDIDKAVIAPDFPESIKNYLNPPLTQHRYTFLKAGTYKVVFIAANRSIDDEKSVIREITLTIKP